jgi:pimeloyl-ACP methyl ester carboxylesterase
LGDARLLVIPGAGHYPHVEAPTRFFGDVGWFLSGKWPDDARQVERSP